MVYCPSHSKGTLDFTGPKKLTQFKCNILISIICHRSFVEIKLLELRYVARAIPGKSLKRKTTESDDKREKTKKYEENRKTRKFNVKWLTNREWLDA
jgi:hypothetical protein